MTCSICTIGVSELWLARLGNHRQECDDHSMTLSPNDCQSVFDEMVVFFSLGYI